jgi:hypothetical protein
MSAPTQEWAKELELVDQALAVGDVPHALTHLGGALALAPNQEQVHARVEAVAAKYPLLELLPKNEFLGAGVLEAFALRRVGRVDEAVVLLAQLTEVFPGMRFETLLAAWIVTARTAGTQLKPETLDQVTRLLMKVGEGTIGLHRLHAGERELLSGYEALADAALEGPGAREHLRFSASGLYRRLGQFKKALSAVEGQTGYFSFIQRGLAQRASGDAAAALATFQAASKLPEASQSDTLEQVRCHLALGNTAAAKELLGQIPPEQMERDVELQGLQFFAETPPKGDVIDALDALRRTLRGPIEQPSDATANIFREHREKLPPGTTRMKLAVNGWESPSNHLMVALFMSGTSELAQGTYELTDVPKFERDPCKQVRGEPPPTWKKLATQEVVQVIAKPPPAALLSQLAAAGGSSVFHEVWARAGELAKKVTTTPSELMTAMVHPPSDPAWLEGLPDALFRFQVATACVLAQLPRPWSELKGAFESLLFGPVDWSSAAAVMALGEKARRDPEAARDALKLLSDVTTDLLPHTAEPRAHPLMIELGTLPAVSDEARRILTAWYAKQFPRKEEEAVEPTPAPVAPVAPQPLADPGPGIPGWVWLVGTLLVIAGLIAIAR